jgi:hypothetical protein
MHDFYCENIIVFNDQIKSIMQLCCSMKFGRCTHFKI